MPGVSVVPEEAARPDQERVTAPGPGASRFVRLVPWIAGLFVVVVGGFGLAAREGLSTDEGWSVSIAHRDLSGVLDVIALRERNMALYYLVLHVWTRVSDEPAWLYALSLVFAVATIAALAWLGRLLGGPPVAAVATAVTAANFAFLTYAVEVRAYSLGMLLAVLTVGSFVRLLRTHSPVWAVAYVVTGLLLVSDLVLGVLLLAALGLVAVLRPEGRVRPVLAALAVQAAVVLPVLYLVLSTDPGVVDWIPRPTVRDVAEIPLLLVGGSVIAVLAVGAALIWSVVQLGRQGATRAVDTWIVVAWAVVPPALLVAVSFVKPLLIPRYLLFVLPAVGLLAGLALCRHRWGVPLGLLLAAVLGITGSQEPWTSRSDDLTAATAFVLAEQRQGDAVVYDPAAARAWFGPYLGTWTSDEQRPRDLALLEGHDPWSVGDVYGDEADPDELVRRAATVERLWVVHYPEWGITGQTPEPFRAARDRILADREAVVERWFGEAVVTLYVPE
jgi:mannosyltransferase